MQWFTVICVLPAIVTAVIANDRTKRTIPYLGISQESLPSVADNAILYKIPGYDDVLFSFTPKQAMKKTTTPININIAVPNNDSLNKTCDEAPSGFQMLVDLIKTGIQNKKQLLGKLLAPPTPVNPIIIINEETKYPVIQEIKRERESLPPAVGVKYTETVEVDSKPMAIPMDTMITKPKQVITEIVQPTYSYKQASKDGTVMSYEFEDNPNIIVTETVAMPPLPSYIKSRFEEIVSSAVVPSLMRVPGTVLREDITFGPPIIPENFGNIITPLPPVAAPIYPPAFARLQSLGYFEGGDFYGQPILVQEDIPVLLRSTTDIFKMPGPKGDVNVKIRKNNQPTSINRKSSKEASTSSIHFSKTDNSGPKATPSGISEAIPGLPSLSNIGLNSISDLKTLSAKSPMSEKPINSINNVINDESGNMVIKNEHNSSFVYKQVRNKYKQPFVISQAALNSNSNLENKNVENYISDKGTNYYFVPPVKGSIEPLPINIQRTSSTTQETVQTSSKATLNCLDISQAQLPLCPEQYSYRKENSLKSSPIVVPDTSFVYKQINADGSSMTTTGSQNNVVVDVQESRSVQETRGDIPQDGVYK